VIDTDNLVADSADDTIVDFSSVTCADITTTDCGAITTTALVDIGGGSLEVPNGDPTTDSVGEIGVDTTSDQFHYYGASERVVTYLKEKCFTLESPSDDDDDVPFFFPEKAITVHEIRCISQGGTSTVVVVGDGTNDMDSITCATSTTSDTSLSNNTFTANERMQFDIGTVTGTVDWVNYCIRYTITAD